MLFEITPDHIIHICIMPAAENELDQSAFQGFVRGLLDQPQMQLISNTSLFPRHILELFLDSSQLIHFRNKNSISSLFLLDVNSVLRVLPLIFNYPYVVISCLERDLKTVKNLMTHFTCEPIIVCGENIHESKAPIRGYFSLDELLAKKLRIEAQKHKGDAGLQEVASKKLRQPTFNELDFHSRNHGVTIPTETVLRSLGHVFQTHKAPPNSKAKDVYISAMLEISDKLMALTGYDKGITKSDLIINTTSMYAHLYNFNSHLWNLDSTVKCNSTHQDMKVSYDSHCTTFILGGIEKHKWHFIRSSPVSNDTRYTHC